MQRLRTGGSRPEQPHNNPQESIRRNALVATFGEVFPDGVILELVRDSTQAARLHLLAWDGTMFPIGANNQLCRNHSRRIAHPLPSK